MEAVFLSVTRDTATHSHTTNPSSGRGRGEGGYHRSSSYEEFSGVERGAPPGGYYYRGGGEAPWGGLSPEGRGSGFPPTGNHDDFQYHVGMSSK